MRLLQAGLLGKGAGHVLLRVAEKQGCDIREAAAAILEDKDILNNLFEEVTQ